MNAKTAKTANVVAINPKGDKAQAATAHAKDRCLILDGIDQAEGLLGDALVSGLRMTAMYGPTSREEVAAHYTRCNNPAVYASWFNLGDRAQQVVGEKLALEAIERAAKGPRGFQRAREALLGITRAAKAATGKSDGELTGRAAQNAVKEAVAAATTKAAERKAEKSAKIARGTKSQDAATMASAALECGKGHREMAAFILLASQQAARLPEVQGRETAHRNAVKLLGEAAEAWGVFAK